MLEVDIAELPELLEAIHEATANDRPPEPKSEEWRAVVADMVRIGADRGAIAVLVEKSPEVAPYIRALEALFEAFAKLPALDAYEHMLSRSVGHWTGKIELREKADAYAKTVQAWQAVHELQASK